MVSSPSSQIISKILSPAVQFWLHSQVEEVKTLQFKIQGRDQEILHGYIPSIYLYSQAAIYQGLHLGQIEVLAANIRINIGQILRGKPLHLLEPIQVSGQVKITKSDLKASLNSSLLSHAFNDLLLLLLESSGVREFERFLTEGSVRWQNIDLGEKNFKIQGIWTKQNNAQYPFTLISGLRLSSPQIIHLYSLQIEGLPSPYQVNLTELPIELGNDVKLSTLLVSEDEVTAEGQAIIIN